MNNRRAYEIPFVGLKPGIHEFEYRVDDKFFAEYGDQEFTNSAANVKLLLEKNAGFMMLKFDVDGKADVTCDRCGNNLTMNLWDEFKMMVKLVDDPATMNDQEEDPDVYYISKNESHLFVGDWIYEFVSLSLPLQKRCSEQEMGGPQCNIEVLERLKRMEDDVKKEGNPIWKDLDQFKNLQ
jgi:uncharacterized metal-binding protein YceD (DUF177 family)